MFRGFALADHLASLYIMRADGIAGDSSLGSVMGESEKRAATWFVDTMRQKLNLGYPGSRARTLYNRLLFLEMRFATPGGDSLSSSPLSKLWSIGRR